MNQWADCIPFFQAALVRVPVILDGIVGSAWHKLGNLRPPISKILLVFNHRHFICSREGRVIYARIQLVQPADTALFPRSLDSDAAQFHFIELGGQLSPAKLLSAVLVDQSSDRFILIFTPWPYFWHLVNRSGENRSGSVQRLRTGSRLQTAKDSEQKPR
jgi:hypothetical protein